MHFSIASLNPRQRCLTAEVCYLFFIGVVSPLAVGLQIYDQLPMILSLLLQNILGIPVIMVFYRIYLPETFGRKRYLLFVLLFPAYIFFYEIASRLTSLILINLPFIPSRYRENLAGSHPEDFTQGYFNQTVGYTSLILLAATSLYVLRLLIKNQHNLTTVANQKLTLELDQLKAQVQPHFFFNTLNNMYALSIQNSPRTPQMITDLSAIMRYVLYDARPEKVSLEQEITFIRSFIHLENLRHNQEDLIEFLVQGDINNVQIEPLIFLPLIENSFKHVLHRDTPVKWVRLILTVDDKELVFQTTNAKSIGSNEDRPMGGIGLTNVRTRLKLLYPDRHELVIHDEADSFTVTLTITRAND